MESRGRVELKSPQLGLLSTIPQSLPTCKCTTYPFAMRKLLLLLCVAALVATAAAHKRQPKQGDACHIRRYACVSSKAFCNGGTVMACPAGEEPLTLSDRAGTCPPPVFLDWLAHDRDAGSMGAAWSDLQHYAVPLTAAAAAFGWGTWEAAASCTHLASPTCNLPSSTPQHAPRIPTLPAGTTCVTQYGKNALKVSPCVTRSARHRSLLGGWHKPQHKPQPKPTHTAPRCHADNYVCLSPSGHAKTSTRFCLGGYSMACPAGTVCRTQPRHKRQSVSPCGWP